MAVGDTITAARYNAIRNTLRTVLGTNNTGSDGYGQYVVTTAKADNDIVDHVDMYRLYVDLVRARTHQTGNPPTWTNSDGLAVPTTGDIIGEFAGAVGANPGESSADATTDLGEGYVDYESAQSNISAGAQLADSTQMSIESLTSSALTNASWNNTISHVVTITFGGYSTTNPIDSSSEAVTGADHRRYFFNAGGEIQFDASLTGGTSGTSGTKDYDWSVMLSNMGTITFGAGTTGSSTGSGTGSNLGNFDMTTSYQTVYTKTGTGNYAENDYTIRARAPSTDSLQFEITFNDDDTGDEPISPPPSGGIVGGVDENVTGSTTSNVGMLRPDGDNLTIGSYTYTAVVVPAPTAANNSNL